MSATRSGDAAARVRRALVNSRPALDELRMALAAWCDSIAQYAVARQGFTGCAADPSKDPEYRLALDALRALYPLHLALAAAEARFTEAGSVITPDIGAERAP